MDPRRYTIIIELGDHALSRALLIAALALLAVAAVMVVVHAAAALRTRALQTEGGEEEPDTARIRPIAAAILLTVLASAAVLGAAEAVSRSEPGTAESAARIREKIAAAWPLATVELPSSDDELVSRGSWPARLNSMDCLLVADRQSTVWTAQLQCQGGVRVPVTEQGLAQHRTAVT